MHQNTPRRCILHSNTHLDPLIKCPKQKITQPLHLHINSQHFQALGPVVFSLSLRTAKNLFTSIRNVSKTLPSIYYAPDQKKATLLLTALCGFSSYTVKNLNLLYTSLKTLQLLDFCSQSEKTYTFRLLPVRVLSCTLLKILLTTVKTNFQKLPQL